MGLNYRAALSNITNFKREAFGKHASQFSLSQSILEDSLFQRRRKLIEGWMAKPIWKQTDLLVAAARTGKIVNIKKGQFCAPSVMVNSAEKIQLAGNPNVMVCERGTMFGYNDLIVDPRNLEWIREANCPVLLFYVWTFQEAG
ncbi:2-dehydro-3-deoxyphosphooctonate aldolase-like [Rosa rugosa]|uniref:2-dehydro-3-deoxyphosphooctonate aldolase-like n=1 Tax=Rosa rugosa TaxID=74645 RepID=UPI002B4075E7|nr:2-dehydro-3-deoxyphosphooctonate aldolase-like [Rosa rugosa]